MNLTRYYAYEFINWAALPELPAKLRRFDIETSTASVDLSFSTESVTVDSLEAAAGEVSKGVKLRDYCITVRGKKTGSNVEVLLCLARTTNIYDQRFASLSINGLVDRSLSDSVAEFLGLQKETSQRQRRERTVFLAHGFDDVGTACSEKVARFLELLGFLVVSGREFAPGSIAQKVRTRLSAQAIVVAILTASDDQTWLIQESLLGDSHDKPLFILRENGAAFKPGILGDHEYIRFQAPAIESTFARILEGLRGIGYEFGPPIRG